MDAVAEKVSVNNIQGNADKQVKDFPTLAEVDAFEVPGMLVPRIMKNYGYSQELSEGLVREVKRMLYLSVITQQFVVPSLKVDDAWHEMLLFTRFYMKLCKFFGGGFLHHDPTPGQPDGGKAYLRTKENYEKTFGFAPDKEYWG